MSSASFWKIGLCRTYFAGTKLANLSTVSADAGVYSMVAASAWLVVGLLVEQAGVDDADGAGIAERGQLVGDGAGRCKVLEAEQEDLDGSHARHRTASV